MTLTWAHKGDALISTPDGGYEWVDRDDPRANEVRLLEEVDRVGKVIGDASDNLLIRGDGLDALRTLVKHPEYAAEYRGKVKLVYIDPPFNTGQAFEHYDDGLEHSVWLGMMRERLDLISELLAPDGSVWVHLDDAEMAYARVLMDEIFGRSNFVATVVWQRTNSPRNSAKHFSLDVDYILVFAKDLGSLRMNLLGRTAAMDAKFKNPDSDPRGPWFASDLSARNFYSKGQYTVTAPAGKSHGPGAGRYWAVSEETLAALDADNRIWWGASRNNKPTRKLFLSDVQAGRIPSSMWLPEEVGYVRNGKQETKALLGGNPFATPKPEKLMERVLQIATDPGDIVIDCFAGSGTTAAVAHKLSRRWVTAEISEATVDSYIGPRLRKVVAGDDAGGVTSSAGWEGGGGFRQLRVSNPVFEVADIGGLMMTAVADGTDDERFAASVAAQLGYEEHSFDELPFAGRKGRSRLAVIRGVLDVETTSALLSGVDENETLLVAATSVDDAARDHLRAHSRGSRIVRIPAGLFPKGGVR
ncbi:site-specific DNA-methyltransferase [Microbacterium laevaniformans]|uniref:site-specific DNA-methyltransferase n=1 Tax=Microbacterium laevaniformans TaxID=36807 RepID=UPI003D97FD0A